MLILNENQLSKTYVFGLPKTGRAAVDNGVELIINKGESSDKWFISDCASFVFQYRLLQGKTEWVLLYPDCGYVAQSKECLGY